MLRKFREWLRNSSRFHLRQPPPNSMQDLVALLDRFLDDNLSYELEWDDFISWKSDNYEIELMRSRILRAEPLFFSKNATNRQRAIELVIGERNRAAALIGLQPREVV